MTGWTALAMLGGCLGEGPSQGSAPRPLEPPDGATTEIPTAPYTLDPAAGDPAVPADLGGPGFTGEGWTTRAELYRVGDPDAPQGGTLTTLLEDWPPTLRVVGPNALSAFNSVAGDLLYESLLAVDPVTMELAPRLATHWTTSDDGRTWRFRLNPQARWSDGREVTADDVVATHRLRTDPRLADPQTAFVVAAQGPAEAVSKYIVQITIPSGGWRPALDFATAWVLPAAELGAIDPTTYLARYQFSHTAVSGPYEVKLEEVEAGASITLSRRQGWWGDGIAAWDGLHNIGKIKLVVVRDPPLAYERLKRGELDYLPIRRAQWWVEDIPAQPAVRRGLLVPTKFWTELPRGVSGVAINLQKPPLDDPRVRRALQLTLDRPYLVAELFHGEYEPLNSYFQGPFSDPAAPPLPYDEAGARALLEEAGWVELNRDGYRTRDGKELALTLSYDSALQEKLLLAWQESCRKVGVKLELQLLPASTRWKNLLAKDYQLDLATWAGEPFPNPAASWGSRMAFEKDSPNVTGYYDSAMDSLLWKYERERDPQGRVALLRQMDTLLLAEAPYVLTWYAPAERVLYWNRFGMPPWGTARTGPLASAETLFATWWIDPDRERTLGEAAVDPTVVMTPGPPELPFWRDFARAHPLGGPIGLQP